MDCFVAEFILGHAEGGTRWLLAMTTNKHLMVLAAFLSPTVRAFCPFMSAVTVPYSPDGEESKQSQKAGQNSEIESASSRRAADRAGAGGTAQPRDQPRRCWPWLRHRIAAAAGQFERPPLRRRGRGASRAGVDARHQR